MKYITERTFIAYCMALLAVLFLSSVVPVGAVEKDQSRVENGYRSGNNNPFSGAIGFTVELEKEFPTTPQEPVEHVDFDISAHLDGWYEMFAAQLALGILNDAQEAEERQRLAELKRLQSAWSGKEIGVYLTLLLAIGFATIGYLTYRKP